MTNSILPATYTRPQGEDVAKQIMDTEGYLENRLAAIHPQ